MTEPAGDLGLEPERIEQYPPDSPALSDSRHTLTYGELLSSARALAASLGPVRGEPRRPVALLMPHRTRTVGLHARGAARAAAPTASSTRPSRGGASRRCWRRWSRRPSGPRTRSSARGSSRWACGPTSPSRRVSRRPPRARHPRRDQRTSARSTSPRARTGSPKLVGYRHGATRHRAELYAAAIDAGPQDRFSLVSPLWTAAAASAIFTALAQRGVASPAGARHRRAGRPRRSDRDERDHGLALDAVRVPAPRGRRVAGRQPLPRCPPGRRAGAGRRRRARPADLRRRGAPGTPATASPRRTGP